MNDILEGKWKVLRGQAKEWWGELTDDDLTWVGGKFEKLVGVLQQRYGYAREQAESEIRRRLEEFERKLPVTAAPETMTTKR